MKKRLFKAAVVLLTVILLFGIFTVVAMGADDGADPKETVTVTPSDALSYKILFAVSDGSTLDTNLAVEVSSKFAELGAFISPSPDIAEKETNREILLGVTNRELSMELYERVTAKAAGGSLVWAVAERDGVIAYVASSDAAFERGKGDLLALFGEGGLTVAKDHTEFFVLTKEEYEAELKAEQDRIEAEKEAARLQYIEELRKIAASFDMEDFYTVNTFNQYNLSASKGGKQDNYPLVDYGAPVRKTEYVMLPTNEFKDPHAYPVDSEHPYLYFTKNQIPEIRAVINNPNYAAAAEKFWDLANTDNFTGIMPESISSKGNPYRYDGKILTILEAKALAYVITGDERYGLEAIIGAKNAMITVAYIMDIHMDPYHGFANVLESAMKVYDWCYDLMTETDKQQFVLGFQNRISAAMEYNLFRVGQGLSLTIPSINAVSGHGMGAQFIIKFVTMALVVYHECPNWWDYIGGKYYEMNVPVYSSMYTDGYATQGTATYGQGKYLNALCSAMCIYNSTGFYPDYIDLKGARLTAYHLIGMMTPNDRYFATGDGDRYPEGSSVNAEYLLTAAALFRDPDLFLLAKKYSSGFNGFSAETFIYSSYFDPSLYELAGQYSENIDLLRYFSSPNGYMAARNSWDPDAAAVFMKIGEKTMANHDIADHGTFQIYYKGMLAGSSGAYNMYGSYVHKYYLQSTVAHNGVLVFNPSLADDKPIYGINSDGTENKNVILNHSRYYYSGSQRRLSETSSLDIWKSDLYTMAKVTGAEYAYDYDGSAKYAYIAGDMTAAYPTGAVNYAGRSMLAIFTGDEDAPMMFFVYDRITSPKESFTKTFLLHTVKEPEISDDGKSAVVSGALGGILSVNLVSGAERITKIGGAGYATWINGKNCTDEYAPDDGASRIWGRLEIGMTGKKTDDLLVAMYVTDNEANKSFDVESIDLGDRASAVKMGNTVTVFSHSEVGDTEGFTFNSGERGMLNYYIAGLYAGEWLVTFDDTFTIKCTAEEGSGLIDFVGPAGKIEIKPNGSFPIGSISYVSGGGIMPEDTPYRIYEDRTVELPSPTREGASFVGWYTSPYYTEETRITHVDPAIHSGKMTLYARWSNFVIAKSSYEALDINASSTSNSTRNNITYYAKDKTGASFSAVNEDGKYFVRWIKGSKDSFITVASTASNLSVTGDDALSYEISFSTDGDAPLVGGHIRVMATTPSTGKNDSTLMILGLNSSGDITLSQDSTKLANISDGEIYTLRLVLDFKNELIIIYGEDAEVLYCTTLTVPTIDKDGDGVKDQLSPLEWKNYLTNYSLYWYSSSKETNAAMRIYGIKVVTGNIFGEAPKAPALTLVDTNYAELDMTSTEDGNVTEESVTYCSTGKSGARFETVTDESGSYLLWTKGTDDSYIRSIQSTNLANANARQFSYTVTLSKNGDTAHISGHIRIMGANPKTGETQGRLTLITFARDGAVMLGTETKFADLSSGDTVTVRLLIDFEAGKLVTYGENGEILASMDLVPPKIDLDGDGEVEAELSADEWQKYVSNYVFYWYSNGNDTDEQLRIYKIRVAAGNEFEK